jgi:hypothetical protein
MLNTMLQLFLMTRLILVLCMAPVAQCQSTLDEESSDKDQQSNFLLELKEIVNRYGNEMRQVCQEHRQPELHRRNRDEVQQQTAAAANEQETLQCRNQNESLG